SPEVKSWYEESMQAILNERKVDNIEFYLVKLDMKKGRQFPIEGSNIRMHHGWINDKAPAGEQSYAIVEKSDEFITHDETKKTTDDEEFSIVDEQPIFPGGTQEFYKYITQNIKYPQEAQAQKIAGKVYVEFVVDKNGSIIDVKTVKGIGGGCDEEAVRVIQNSPK